jgi:hypothetical protein
MIVSAIIKAIIFYILFITIRSLLRGGSAVAHANKQFKKHQQQANQGRRQNYSQDQGDVVEAEYRVID